jgi:hypothetical protein
MVREGGVAQGVIRRTACTSPLPATAAMRGRHYCALPRLLGGCGLRALSVTGWPWHAATSGPRE